MKSRKQDGAGLLLRPKLQKSWLRTESKANGLHLVPGAFVTMCFCAQFSTRHYRRLPPRGKNVPWITVCGQKIPNKEKNDDPLSTMSSKISFSL
jgi:hypothetical protein